MTYEYVNNCPSFPGADWCLQSYVVRFTSLDLGLVHVCRHPPLPGAGIAGRVDPGGAVRGALDPDGSAATLHLLHLPDLCLIKVLMLLDTKQLCRVSMVRCWPPLFALFR